MASWPRHLLRHPLIPRVYHPQSAYLYSTVQEQSLQSSIPRISNAHNNHGSQRKPWSPNLPRRVGPLDLSGETDAEEIYGKLRIEASHGSSEGIVNANALAGHLVRALGRKPDMRIFSPLILANCSAEGSITEVKQLIRELRAESFDLDSSACHDVLKVLAVHPDYLLQTDILNYMQSKWFNLTENGWHDVLTMLLRDSQFEMVLEKLDRMRGQGMQIRPWLYDLTIYKFAEIGELDVAFLLLKQRIGDGESNISAQLWYYLLDMASRALHYDLTHYVWKSRVQTRYLNPSSGICVQTLNIAARQGDTQLATDVISFLEERPGNTFDHSHYELLIAAYVNSSNLENALAILSVMQTVNVLPNNSTTRHIYQYLTKSKHLPREAFAILRELHGSGQPISVAAINCLINAATHFEDLNLALDFYKSIHELCVSAKPNNETFNILLRACRVCGDRKDIALILAAEMVGLKIQPNALTYDRMLLICIRQKDDYEDGMRYFQEMQTHKMRARYGTLLAVVRRLTVEADERVEIVLEEMEQLADTSLITRLRKWVHKYWGNKSIAATRDSSEFSFEEGREAFSRIFEHGFSEVDHDDALSGSQKSKNRTDGAALSLSQEESDLPSLKAKQMDNFATPPPPKEESDVASQKEPSESLDKENKKFLEDTTLSSGDTVDVPIVKKTGSIPGMVDDPVKQQRLASLANQMDGVLDGLGGNDEATWLIEERLKAKKKKLEK